MYKIDDKTYIDPAQYDFVGIHKTDKDSEIVLFGWNGTKYQKNTPDAKDKATQIPLYKYFLERVYMDNWIEVNSSDFQTLGMSLYVRLDNIDEVKFPHGTNQPYCYITVHNASSFTVTGQNNVMKIKKYFGLK
jgi:hypothetical protein